MEKEPGSCCEQEPGLARRGLRPRATATDAVTSFTILARHFRAGVNCYRASDTGAIGELSIQSCSQAQALGVHGVELVAVKSHPLAKRGGAPMVLDSK